MTDHQLDSLGRLDLIDEAQRTQRITHQKEN